MWPADKLSELTEQLTNLLSDFTDIEVAVRNATNDEPWGPTSTQLQEITQASFLPENFSQIMNMLWRRIFSDNGTLPKCISKSLTVIRHLLLNGSKDTVYFLRQNIEDLKRLEHYTHIDTSGTDQGSHVRSKANMLIELVNNDKKLNEERQTAESIKTRLIGISSENVTGARSSGDDERYSTFQWNSDAKTMDGGTKESLKTYIIPSHESIENEEKPSDSNAKAEGREICITTAPNFSNGAPQVRNAENICDLHTCNNSATSCSHVLRGNKINNNRDEKEYKNHGPLIQSAGVGEKMCLFTQKLNSKYSVPASGSHNLFDINSFSSALIDKNAMTLSPKFSCPPFTDKIVSSATDDQLMYPVQFTVKKLPIGALYSVFVPQIIDGPSAFFIQINEKSEQEKLKNLQARLNNPNLCLVNVQHSSAGLMCLARVPHDNVIGRAVMLHVQTYGAEVFFVDLGIIKSVDFSQIYNLPVRFLEEAMMAVQCSLFNSSKNPTLQTSEAKRIFGEIVESATRLRIQIKEPEVKTKQFVEMFLCDGTEAQTSVLDMILYESLVLKMRKYRKISLEENSIENIIVISIDSPQKFFVQLRNNRDDLSQLIAKVQGHCNMSAQQKFAKIEDVEENMVVCCRFRVNLKWQRGIITRKFSNSETVIVFLVDHGKSEIVHFSELLFISQQIIEELPAQAIECQLDIEEKLAVKDVVKKYFVKLAEFNYYKMKVKSIKTNAVFVVDLIDEDNKRVTDLLKKEFLL